MVMYGLKKVANGNQRWLFFVSIVLQLTLGGPQKVNYWERYNEEFVKFGFRI